MLFISSIDYEKVFLFLFLLVAVICFTNCDRNGNINNGNNVLYTGYLSFYDNYATKAFYGYVGGDRVDCEYTDGWSLKILDMLKYKNHLYMFSSDTILSTHSVKNVLRKNGKIVRDDLPAGKIYFDGNEIRVYSQNFSLAPSETYKSTVWIDGKMNDLRLEEPIVDVVVYYPVILDIEKVGNDFYYMGFYPSANGIVAAVWKNESLLYYSKDIIKNKTLPAGFTVYNGDCYWLFQKDNYTAMYKNDEIIYCYGDSTLVQMDNSNSYLPLDLCFDNDDQYVILRKHNNNNDEKYRYYLTVYKNNELLFEINGYPEAVSYKNGVIYSIISYRNTSGEYVYGFYENDRVVSAQTGNWINYSKIVSLND